MWCKSKHNDCPNDCTTCQFNSTKKIKQFNYECPNCNGKFQYPNYKKPGISAHLWRCPFCDIAMLGIE